jgi:hypothetical protein
MEKQQLMDNVNDVYAYFLEAIKQIPEVIQVKGRGLCWREFDFDVVHFVKDDYRQTYFTGNANNKTYCEFYLLNNNKTSNRLVYKGFTRSFSR